MKKIVISLLAVLAFSWASGVAADQSPESIVSCSSTGIYGVAARSIAEGINAEQCYPPGSPIDCATCIRSLEAQGCKVVDVVVNTLSSANVELDHQMVVNYLLS